MGWLARISVAPVGHLARAAPGHPLAGAGLIVPTEKDRCCCSTISGHQLANVGFKHWKKEQRRFALEKEPQNLSSSPAFQLSAKIIKFWANIRPSIWTNNPPVGLPRKSKLVGRVEEWASLPFWNSDSDYVIAGSGKDTTQNGVLSPNTRLARRQNEQTPNYGCLFAHPPLPDNSNRSGQFSVKSKKTSSKSVTFAKNH